MTTSKKKYLKWAMENLRKAATNLNSAAMKDGDSAVYKMAADVLTLMGKVEKRRK